LATFLTRPLAMVLAFFRILGAMLSGGEAGRLMEVREMV
jgi:hypothetical protein